MEKTLIFSLKSILIFLTVFLFLHISATFYHLYWLFPWFDIPMHFIGGFLLAMIFFYLWRFAHISIGTGVSFAPAANDRLPLVPSTPAITGDQARRNSESCRTKHGQIANMFVMLVLMLGFVALIGVLWEFYEFLHDFYLLTGGKISVFQNSFADTIKDLFFDLVGGTTAFAIFYKRSKTTNSSESTNKSE